MSLARLHVGLPLAGINLGVPPHLPVPDAPSWSAHDLDGLRFVANRHLRPWPAVGAYAARALATKGPR